VISDGTELQMNPGVVPAAPSLGEHLVQQGEKLFAVDGLRQAGVRAVTLSEK